MAVTKGLHAHVVPFFVPAGILRAANETEMSVVEDSNIMTAQTNQIKSRLIYVRLDGLPVAVAQPCHRDECHVEEPVTGETFFQVVVERYCVYPTAAPAQVADCGRAGHYSEVLHQHRRKTSPPHLCCIIFPNHIEEPLA
jgi:hypothetical protein